MLSNVFTAWSTGMDFFFGGFLGGVFGGGTLWG